jgi:hypothetical protein
VDLRSRVTLGLALLALGCGSGGGLDPDGSAGAGGTSGASGSPDAGAASGGAGAGGASGGAGAGGASGGAGASGALCTTGFEPCGGDVVGSWVIDHHCEPPGQVQSADSCMGETFDFTKVLSDESWAFHPDGALTLTLSAAGPASIVVPDACLARMTPPLACTNDGAGAGFVHHLSFPGGMPSTPSCQDASGICTCALSIVAAPMSSSATYTTAGATLTVSVGTSVLAFDYCVAATTLKLRARNADNSTGPVLLYDKQ